MIEGGKAGASALAQAARRRAEVERLVGEAQHYETLAADERIMAAQLATLPPSYAILHDLQVPESPSTVDHLVVGQGGAFLVVTRRYPDAIAFHDGELWSGGRSLRPDIDGARIASALLTRALATPVVPLIGFVGTLVPNATPPVVHGVLACSADYVARVITRASHTMLTPPQFSDVLQRAMPFLTTSVIVQRHDPRAQHVPVAVPFAPTGEVSLPRAQRVVDPVVDAVVEGPVVDAVVDGPVVEAPVVEGSVASKEAEPVVSKEADPKRRRFGHRWSRLGTRVAVVLALVAIVVVVGLLVRTLWGGNASSAEGATTTSVGPTTTSPYVPGPSHPTLGDQVVAPEVSFVATCPAKAAGWTLTPNWPGDLDHLAAYVVEVRDLKGPWHRLGSFTSRDDLARGALVHQKPGAASGVRITAVMSDGSRSPNAPAIVAAPKSAC